MKLQRNGNNKAKELTKNSSVCRSYQAQLMGRRDLIIFTQITHSWTEKRQRRTKDILSIFKKDRFLDLMIINFEIPPHTNILCKSLRVYKWVDQKWVSVHFLFLSKNVINSGFKIPASNFCCLITPQTDPGYGRCAATWNFNCLWQGWPNLLYVWGAYRKTQVIEPQHKNLKTRIYLQSTLPWNQFFLERFANVILCDSGSQTFFVATSMKRFAGLASHQGYDVNKETYYQSFIDCRSI